MEWNSELQAASCCGARLFLFKGGVYMAVFSTPDGKKFEADSATVRQLLEAWRLKKAIGATVGGEIVDCDKVFTEDTAFTPLFPDCEEGLQLLRHSTAHLLAHAVLRLYPFNEITLF